ncbi:hypothetical protein AKJ55_00580 [candidate division MSBL1 archaeon SCGC-AAA382M17]|uniref:PDZ domain-containing protein n=1 Tax=candidate division MSBL1 archaeon SCGC-AAA382M17 TaxID=1698284 RepID=A0ABR5TJW8_9EURY|nr:hypothetical protein AKJ55_00580 [candidate division MSBL1 archaeon SCGC-AAA382M17]
MKQVDVLCRLIIFLVIVAVFWPVAYLIDRRFDLGSFGFYLSPGVLLWKTKRGLRLLDRASERWRGFWRGYGYLSAVVGVALMAFFLFILISGTVGYFSLLLGPGKAPAIPLILKERALILPGVNIPLVSGLVAFLLVVFVHESSHGLVFRSLGYTIKSAGLALFIAVPGAFVEQDEEEYEEASAMDRVRPTSAGPMANILLGLLALGLLFALVTPHPGLLVGDVEEGSPASEMGLESGDRITSIGGREVFNSSDLVEFLRAANPGEKVVLGMEERHCVITLRPHPKNENVTILLGGMEFEGYGPVRKVQLLNSIDVLIGMPYSVLLGQPVFNQADYTASAPWGVVHTLNWIFALSVLVALFNLLPLKPLDGGHMIEGVAEKLTSGYTTGIIVKGAGVVTFGLLALNVVAVIVG